VRNRVSIDYLLSLEDTELCRFPKGTYLIKQGESVKSLYYLTSGVCDRIEYGETGDAVIYNTKYSNNGMYSLIGVNLLWAPSRISYSSFIAQTEIKCYKINAQKAFEYINTQLELLSTLLSMMGDNYIRLREAFRCHKNRQIPNFLCRILLENCQTVNKRIIIQNLGTYSEIALRLGVHQVTIARIMARLRQDRIIGKKTPLGIPVLNNRALEDIAKGKPLNY
jgi:CRP-like cAMP-binding protein